MTPESGASTGIPAPAHNSVPVALVWQLRSKVPPWLCKLPLPRAGSLCSFLRTLFACCKFLWGPEPDSSTSVAYLAKHVA